jgi:hypothetical protein
MARALVVYESMWGNTEAVARAVAAGLAPSMEVTVTDVQSAPAAPADDVTLVVAGGPTHAFAMTRPSTRADAERQGATRGSVDRGLREWLEHLPEGRHPQRLATFDTRVAKVRHVPGSAAKGAARVGRRHGYQAAAPAESFWVADTEGPLLDGELARATGWGQRLAESVALPH